MVTEWTADSLAAAAMWLSSDDRHAIARTGCWNDAPVADDEAVDVVGARRRSC